MWRTFEDKICSWTEDTVTPKDLVAPAARHYSHHNPSVLEEPPKPRPMCLLPSEAVRPAHALASERGGHFLWESWDQAKVQQAYTGFWRAGPDPGFLSPWYQGVWGGQGGPPCRFLPVHIPCTAPDVHQIPGESCRGALPRLYKQENMTTICPKGFLVPWQHTKH